MADFCSLCGYGDIDVMKHYETYIKPDLKDIIGDLGEGQYYGGAVHGICEHCGLIGLAVDNKYNFWGVYNGEESKIIGHVNEDTLELIIN